MNKLKNSVFNVAKVFISLILLAILFSRVDFRELLSRYAEIQPFYLGIALVLLVVQTILSSLRWMSILSSDDSHIPFVFLWKTYLISNFLSLFLPSSIGGDFYRIYAVKGRSESLGKSTSSVLFDRLAGLFALISIAFVASIFLPENPYNLETFLVYLLIIVVFLLVTSNPVVERLRKFKDQFHNKLLRFPLILLDSFNAYRRDPRKLLRILLFSFLFQANVVVINKFYALSLNVDVPFKQLLVIIPLVYLADALPISIGGLGVRESAFVFFFLLIGRTREEGLAVSLLAGLMRYLMGTIGAILLLISVLKPKPAPDGSSLSENIKT